MIILFLTPVAVLYTVFFLYTGSQSFYVSLFDWSGFESSMTFVGLDNFRELLKDKKIWEVAFPNTLRIFLAGGLLVFGLSFLLSGILTTKIRGKKILRAILFFPAVISPVAIAIMWGFIYEKRWGLLNVMLDAVRLGALQQTWNSPEILPWAILVAFVWMETGFYCVLLVAGLDRVPIHLLEAADIEGANEIQKFFKIKLPLIRDTLTTALILWGIGAVKEFALFFAWGGDVGVPIEGATNLAVRMYMTAFGKRITIFRMGYATTIGVLMFFLVGVIVFTIYMLNRKRDTIGY